MSSAILERCRECGSQGLSEPDLDPCPGLCPRCMDKHLAEVVAALEVVLAGGMPEAGVDAWMRDQLDRIGFVEPWITRFVQGDTASTAAAIREAERRCSSSDKPKGRHKAT